MSYMDKWYANVERMIRECFDEADKAGVGDYAITAYPAGPADVVTEDEDDYEPTYEDVLELNDYDTTENDDIDIATARAAGDETLARMLEDKVSLSIRIATHCRGKLARREAERRPGVMIKAEQVEQVSAVLAGGLLTSKQAAKLLGVEYSTVDEMTVSPDDTYTYSLAPAERTCSNRTCAMTTNVGAPCWNCGCT